MARDHALKRLTRTVSRRTRPSTRRSGSEIGATKQSCTRVGRDNKITPRMRPSSLRANTMTDSAIRAPIFSAVETARAIADAMPGLWSFANDRKPGRGCPSVAAS